MVRRLVLCSWPRLKPIQNPWLSDKQLVYRKFSKWQVPLYSILYFVICCARPIFPKTQATISSNDKERKLLCSLEQVAPCLALMMRWGGAQSQGYRSCDVLRVQGKSSLTGCLQCEQIQHPTEKQTHKHFHIAGYIYDSKYRQLAGQVRCFALRELAGIELTPLNSKGGNNLREWDRGAMNLEKRLTQL